MPKRLDGSLPESLTSEWKRSFRRRLITWYRRHARDLPWRRTSDPYFVWVSEIMLQQTQVATVTPYFERFITTLPDIPSLAEADEQTVLLLWEGLGYYRRARQLHRAARQIVEDHQGRFPRDPDAVRALPGIGRYTAGAILSIAFDIRQPILEANTVRLLSRLIGFGGDTSTSAGQQLLWQTAAELLPRKNVGTHNQALMELGSQTCTPRSPNCLNCPAAGLCVARSENLEDEIPKLKSPAKAEQVREAAVVIFRRGSVLLGKYGDGGRWAGLWDFPRFPIRRMRGAALQRELVDNVQRLTGTTIESVTHLTTIKHGVTRFRITLECHTAHYVAGLPTGSKATFSALQWVKSKDLTDYPLSTTGRKLERFVFRRRC